MTTSFVVAVDGLWRCFAPSIRRIAPVTRARLLRPRAFAHGPHPRCAIALQLRSSSTDAAEAQADVPEYDAFGPVTPEDYLETKRKNKSKKRDTNTEDEQAISAHIRQTHERWSSSTEEERRNTDTEEVEHETSDAGTRPEGQAVQHFDALEEYSVEELYALLRKVSHPPPYLMDSDQTWQRVQEVVYHLARYKGEKPDLRMYAALTAINVSPELGSAAALANLLKDMIEEGLEPDSEICHNVLKALAVHPDYLLRDGVLVYMRLKWFHVSEEGEDDIIAGMIRERQFELAIERLEDMARIHRRLPYALWSQLLFTLVNLGEIDEALRVINWPADLHLDQKQLHLNFWHCLLDAASNQYHLPATAFVWNRMVLNNYLNPPSGICFNVLATAARHGDPQLATDVFRLLTRRRDVLNEQHYESLIEAYIRSGDLESAVSVICIMDNNGVVPEVSTTRSLFLWAIEDPARPMQLFQILKAKVEAGDAAIPTVVMDCIIEASNRHRNLEQAIDFYKALHLVCPAGPTIHTFNTLLHGIGVRRDLAMFLVAEMVELGVQPDALTYDRLILVCIRSDDANLCWPEDAYGYYREMQTRGLEPRSGTMRLLKQRMKEIEERSREKEQKDAVERAMETG